jgi:hypothetical protein
MQPEFPAVEAPRPQAAKPLPPAGKRPAPSPSGKPDAGQIARNAFGLTPEAPPAGRAPVVPSVREDDGTPALGLNNEPEDAAAEFGWEWETPSTL